MINLNYDIIEIVERRTVIIFDNLKACTRYTPVYGLNASYMSLSLLTGRIHVLFLYNHGSCTPYD